MASLIEGYEYDIFISYRQKDNKGNRWVSEFVDALKNEIESTFKEEISIYFDINPHNGLLGTHDVDASLKDKLKCLVFIPIISRTYCDSNSFAWTHEFEAFIDQASKDQYGLKVKLAGGNVANRILPIQIHELDPDDKIMVERKLGGFIRGIEFIYKELGVNRPLTPNDDEKKNLKNTKYNNQINKVANSIKEIISSLKNPKTTLKKSQETSIEENTYKTKKVWVRSIIGLIIGLVITILGFLVVPKLVKSTENLEKSIAVLPFFNNSPDPNLENTAFINTLMEELISNLQSIKEFRVLGRNSIEQYRNNTTKSNPDIAKELGVTYIIEGSGKRYGNTFNLRVRLIKAKGKETQIWTKLYEREVKETEDIVSIPNQIVQAIASELNAAISPEEKQIIEKTPTTSLSAYDFYWKGKEEYLKYYNDNENRDALERAEILYNKALEYDSDFALAYVGLATVYRSKHYWETFFSDKFLDSTLILTNKALSIDNKLAEAYTIKGAYYRDMGKPDLAVKEIDKAIKLNPNDWTSYLIKAQNSGGDLVMGIENYLKVISLNRSSELPTYLRSISQLYLDAGFIEKAKEYLLEAVELDGDSLIYLYNLGAINTWSGNHSIGLEYALKVYVLDSTHLDNLHLLGHTYMFLGKYYESLKYFKKYIDRLQANGSLNLLDMESLGYAYWQTGNKRVAESYFNREIDYCNKAIELGRSFGNDGAYYELAAIYAVLGENEKVMKNLRIYCERQSFTSMYIQLLLNDPMFNTIRNLPEFKQIVNEAEAKYQIVHEKVRKWLDENNML